MLTGKQRAYLRTAAQKQDVILHVGKAGVSEAIVNQAKEALAARELIKCRVLDNAMLTAAEAQALLCEACGAEGVMIVGRMFALYKRRPDKAKILLPEA